MVFEKIQAKQIFTPTGWIENGIITLADDKIVNVWNVHTFSYQYDKVIHFTCRTIRRRP